MKEERARILEKKEKQKKEMLHQLRDFEQRKNGRADLLNDREFRINKGKLMEMGIFEETQQMPVAGDFSLRRHELLK